MRPPVLLGSIQLLVSTILLCWAATWSTPVPRWAGLLDAGLALTLVVTAGVIRARCNPHAGVPENAGEPAGFLLLATLPSLILVALWLGRERLDLNILLPGLAWRLFLVMYTTRYIIAWRHRLRSNPPA
jgi:hypothetical protein